jgi:Flp pilus assembly protein TadD
VAKSKQPTRNVDTMDVQVGNAWTFHFKKQNEQALSEFLRLTEQDPAHIDANYGLALVQAALGHKGEARAAFEKVKSLVAAKISQQAPEDEDPRYAMLSRMIDQQIERLGT